MKLLVVLLMVAAAEGRTFTRCQWASVLQSAGMEGYRGISLVDLKGVALECLSGVCLTEKESHFNTTAVNKKNRNGSKDYGIFQINSRWWCSDGRTPSANGCNVICDDLLTDDVSVAIRCAKRVVRDPQGIAAWMGYRRCREEDLSSYLGECDLD